MPKPRPAEQQLARIKDYKQVFSSQAGERVLQDLVQFAGFLNGGSSTDHGDLARDLGMRNVVIMIMDKVGTDPAALIAHIRQLQERKGS